MICPKYPGQNRKHVPDEEAVISSGGGQLILVRKDKPLGTILGQLRICTYCKQVYYASN